MTEKELSLLRSISAEMDLLPGHTGFYYKNLATGAAFSHRADETFLAASVVKFPLHLLYLQKAAAGEISMAEKLTVTDADKVPVCGALTLFTGPVEADIATLCRLMISLSDNTATNVLIRRLGFDEIERGFAAMGLDTTRIRRCMFDIAASKAGVQNTISPLEMGILLEKLHSGALLPPQQTKEAMDILLQQQIEHKLGGKICGALPIAHKTGEDDNLSNDVGIVFAPQPFILCFAAHGTSVYPWEDLIRRAAYDLWQCQTAAQE